jgi:hypothetical protein
VTVTFTDPGGRVVVTGPGAGGDVVVIVVSLTIVKAVAEADPKWTAVAPVKPVPVIVTVVPPVVGPEAGLRPVTVGRAVTFTWTLSTPMTAVAPGIKGGMLPGGCIALMIASRTVVPAREAIFKVGDVLVVKVALAPVAMIDGLPAVAVGELKLGTEVVGYRPTKVAVSLLERPLKSFSPWSN